MTAREVKIPGPDHPITVEPTSTRVTVRLGERVIADSTRALTVREANYPPIQYLPLADVDPSVITATEHHTYCPYKGDASYYSLQTDGRDLANQVWTYEQPYQSMAAIAGHVAFYPDAVDITLE